MITKIVCLALIVRYTFAEDSLAVALEKYSMNKVILCKDEVWRGWEGDECEGLLWAPQWVVVRSDCVLTKPRSSMTAIRAGTRTCRDMYAGMSVIDSRKVSAIFKHPSQRPAISLVVLDAPYTVTPQDNVTITSFTSLKPWIDTMMSTHEADTRYTYDMRKMFSSPMRMILITTVLPFVSFILFFFFVIHCTSSVKEIPYKRFPVNG